MKPFLLAALVFAMPSMSPAEGKGSHALGVETVEERTAFFRHSPKGFSLISAHRGGNDPGFPENTIEAFRHCLEAAPVMFEIDPRLTKDRQLVLLHDATLDRTTEAKGPVKERTIEELRKLETRDSQGKIQTEIHPPSLDEAIVWAKGKTVLNLDIKDSPPELRLEAVKRRDAFGWVIFTVHEAKQAKWFYEADSRCGFAAVIFDLAQMKTYEEAGIPWENLSIAYVGPRMLPGHRELYDALHSRGVKVMISTCPSDDKLPTVEARAEAYRRIFAAGVDILETDRPAEAAAVLRDFRKK